MPFTDRHLTKALQKEKHDTASQLLKEYANRNWSRLLIESLLEKLINSVLFGSGCRINNFYINFYYCCIQLNNMH